MSARSRTAGRRTAGVAFVLVPVLLAWLAVAVYDKDFSDDATVTVQTDSVGNQMNPGADVKLHGVVVGRVSAIHSDGDRAVLTLAMNRATLGRIPADVDAQLLPTTLFGQRYVALVPHGGSGAALRADAVIPQDRSQNAVELEQVLDHLLPLLDDVRPAELSATLNAVATALSGRGRQLGRTLVQLDTYLKRLNPSLPQLNQDLHDLVQVSDAYADAAPDVLQALTDLTVTSSTVAQQQSQLAALYGEASTTAEDTTAFLQRNRGTVIRLAADSRGTLGVLARYSPEFPCTLRALADFVPVMDKALGKGTDLPGLHVRVTTEPSRGGYRPGTDTPRFTAGGGPSCPTTPYTGHPNTPQENALVNELLADGSSSAQLPDWSSLLAGPLYRGAGVDLR
ncbi:MCE family protein [Streptacidiphilus monticola]|uniref:MCE family protein n=1 Tax=Streptacidiphilus monticola TaxID=2161674 RepID=A0ABW1G7K3_9ACTN